MALIKSVRGKTPQFGKDCYFSENATIIGDLVCGDQCSFWFQSIVRADVNSIQMGNKVNIQDGAVIHCTYKTAPTVLGNNVSVGHKAILHGCTIGDNVLVGMGAIVMDHAIVEDNCIIAAGAVVLQNSHLKTGGIYAGIPAKRVKELPQETFEGTVKRIADSYVMYSDWYKEDVDLEQ